MMLYPQLLTEFDNQAVVSAKTQGCEPRIRVLPLDRAGYLRALDRLKRGAAPADALKGLGEDDVQFVVRGVAPDQLLALPLRSSAELSAAAHRGALFMSPAQFQRVYVGDIELGEAYALNRGSLLSRLGCDGPAPAL